MRGQPQVSVRGGKLVGQEADGVCSFLGVPYASAPENSLLARFGPPVPPPSWRGVRDATSFGPVAPQTSGVPGGYVPGDPTAQAEECRTLNVWTPACDSGRRPVLVFVHGGAFVTGSGSSLLYRGDRLARAGVVVVTFNYRLGALGFLAHPALAHEAVAGCANFGLADQLAALAFVKDHASVFGGDPERVTVFGESAGGISVCDLLGMPTARGLFARAIVQSGMAHAQPLGLASSFAERISSRLGLREITREGLSAVPLVELLEAQRELTRGVDEGLGMPLCPVVDGGLLQRHPADLVASGAGSPHAAVLGGTTRDEFALFSAFSPRSAGLDEEAVAELVGRYLDNAGLPKAPEPAEVVARYRDARQRRGESVGPRALLDAFGTDWVFRLPLLRLLEAHACHGAATFAYRFDWESPFANGSLGACHGIELPFVFGTVEEPVVGLFAGAGPEAMALSVKVRDAWTNFAADGAPVGAELSEWPPYRSGERATMVLGAESHLERAPGEDERTYFESYLGRYGVDGPAEGARPQSLAFMGTDEEDSALGGGEEGEGT
ncbi:MAG: Carboxylic ester hydrolase [Acidimicrobiaceae bacterium]|nr:Carboxylic ester hydrolase [Acidimicrobiaceae bacterium]